MDDKTKNEVRNKKLLILSHYLDMINSGKDFTIMYVDGKEEITVSIKIFK